MLRQSPFDACLQILSGSKSNFDERYNAFFIDYSLLPLVSVCVSVSVSVSAYTLPYPILPYLPTHTHLVLCALGDVVVATHRQPCSSILCTSCLLLSFQQRFYLWRRQSMIVRVSHNRNIQSVRHPSNLARTLWSSVRYDSLSC